MGSINGFLKERKRIAESGDEQVEQLSEVTKKIQKAYDEIKKEEQKVREKFGAMELTTSIISKVLYAGYLTGNPAFVAAGAVVSLLGEGIHAVGAHGEKRLKKEENHYISLADQYKKISSDLGHVLRENHGHIAHLESESEFLKSALLQELQRNSATHLELIKTLETQSKDKEDDLEKKKTAIQKQKGIVATKKSELFEAEERLSKLNAQKTSTYNLEEITRERLKELDPELAKKHAKVSHYVEILWDPQQNYVAIRKSKTWRVYRIGDGEHPALFESESLNAAKTYMGTYNEWERQEKEIEKAESAVKSRKTELTSAEHELVGMETAEKALNGQVQSLEKRLELARKLQPIQTAHAAFQEDFRFKYLREFLGRSADPVLEQALENMDEVAMLVQESRQIVGGALSRVNHLAEAIDGCFDTRLSQKSHTVTITTSKVTKIVTGIVQLLHAFHQVGTLGEEAIEAQPEDSEEKSSEGIDSPEKEKPKQEPPNKISAVIKAVKLGSRLAIPGSDILIAGLELCALFQEQDQTPTEIQRLARALQEFSENIREDINGLHRHLGDVHGDLLRGFDNTALRIGLFEENITQQLAELRSHQETVTHRQTALLNHRDIRQQMRNFHLGAMDPYSRYVQRERHLLEERDFISLFSAFQRRSVQMNDSDNSGLWLKEFNPLIQIDIASDKPQYCTGLLARHMLQRQVPSLYEYEHCAHILSRMGAKILLDDDESYKARFGEEVVQRANELIAHGFAINIFFHRQLLETALEKYQYSQRALVESFKRHEKHFGESNKGALVAVSRSWLQKHQQKHYLIPTADKQGYAWQVALRPRIMGSQRFLFLTHVHRPIKVVSISEIAYKHIYSEMLRQKAVEEWEKSDALLQPFLPYMSCDSGEIGNRADVAAYQKRLQDLSVILADLRQNHEFSLIRLFTNESTPKVAIAQRKTIEGNFLEIAYTIDKGLSPVVRLCNNKRLLGQHSKTESIMAEYRNTIGFSSLQMGHGKINSVKKRVEEELIHLLKGSSPWQHNAFIRQTKATSKEKEEIKKFVKEFLDSVDRSEIWGQNHPNKHYVKEVVVNSDSDPEHDSEFRSNSKLIHSLGDYFIEEGKLLEILFQEMDRHSVSLRALTRENKGWFKREEDRFHPKTYHETIVTLLGKCLTLAICKAFIDFPNPLHEDLSNPLHRNITFASPDEYKGANPMRKFELQGALIATRQMFLKSFEDLFVFSVVQTAEAQNGSGLTGKTFLVLSDHLNQKGLKRLILQAHGLTEKFLRDQRRFEWEGREYIPMPTVGDGACALHALLGTRQNLDGKYYHHEAKNLFKRELSSVLSHPLLRVNRRFNRGEEERLMQCEMVREKLISIIKNHLNSALENGNESAKMLFPDTRPPLVPGIKDQWRALRERHIKDQAAKEALKVQEAPLWLALIENEAFMTKVMEEVVDLKRQASQARIAGDIPSALRLERKPFYDKTNEQVIALSRRNPELLMKVVDSRTDVFLDFADERILAIRQQQQELVSGHDVEDLRFVLKEEVLSRYLETIVDEDFYFHAEEIELAAMIYNKNVQVVSRQEGQIQPSETPFKYGRPEDPVVVIYHEGVHFERCVTYKEINRNVQQQQDLEKRSNLPTSVPKVLHPEFKKQYDESIQKLVKNYAEFLDVQGGKRRSQQGENLFLDTDKFPVEDKKGKPLIKLLTSLNPHHVPLAFPAAFLDRIERDFPVGEFNRVNLGKFLLPYYNFAFNEDENCYELSIAYRVLEREDDLNPKDYYSFVVAQIGRDTVDAFRDKEGHIQDPTDFFHNEFLIQAMYTDFADEGCKSLPGKLSFRLLKTNAESVIPIEEQFKGLFQKFTELGTPKLTPSFNKVTFNRSIPKDLPLIPYNQKAVVATRNKDFVVLDRERRIAKNRQDATTKESKDYLEAQKNYLLLKSLLKLVLDKPRNDEALRSIWSPDQILRDRAVVESIYKDYHTGADQDGKPIEPGRQAKQLKEDILASHQEHPSEERLLIEGHLTNLRAIASHATGEEDHTEQLRILAASGKAQPFSKYETGT